MRYAIVVAALLLVVLACAGTGEVVAVGGGTGLAAAMAGPAGVVVAALSGLVVAFIGLFLVAKGRESDHAQHYDTSAAMWMWWLVLIPVAWVAWHWRHEILGKLSNLKRRKR